MAFYEFVYIIRQDVTMQDMRKIVDSIQNFINRPVDEEDKTPEETLKSHSVTPKVVETEYWGLRKLAYPIKKNFKGHYHMLRIEFDPTHVDVINDFMKNNEDVIRTKLFRYEKPQSGVSLMMQSPSEAT